MPSQAESCRCYRRGDNPAPVYGNSVKSDASEPRRSVRQFRRRKLNFGEKDLGMILVQKLHFHLGHPPRGGFNTQLELQLALWRPTVATLRSLQVGPQTTGFGAVRPIGRALRVRGVPMDVKWMFRSVVACRENTHLVLRAEPDENDGFFLTLRR